MDPWHTTPSSLVTGYFMNHGSAIEQQRVVRSNQIEASLSTAKLNTAFVGSIPEGVTDEVMERLLQSCGPVIKWKRVTDAANMPKNFGFCEFGSADAMSRALSLLHDLPLGTKRLIVKVDDSTLSYLKRYEEAMGQGSVEMSSKEADLAACENIRTILKAKSFFTAMEAIEKRALQLKAEPLEEGEAVDDDDDGYYNPPAPIASGGKEEERDRRSSRRNGKSESRNSSREHQRDLHTNEAQLKAFRDRLSRWESREEQMKSRHPRNQDANKERMAREREEADYAAKYLSSFDDFEWMLNSLDRISGIQRETKVTGRVADFYANRELWKSRRMRDRGREEELDARDEETERRKRAEEIQPVISETSVKRNRPTAAELINDATSAAPVKRRRPLLEKEYTRTELLEAGYSSEQALDKLRQLYREKVAKLIELIPNDRNDLFQWPIEWKYLDENKLLPLIRKKVSEALSAMRRSEREVERIAQSLTAQIQQHSDPTTVVAWVIDDATLVNPRAQIQNQQEEANTFVAILWRYLVFETESAAYNVAPPQ